MNNELMFSSKNDEWETPEYIFEKYNKIYNFTLDVCATSDNSKCKYFFSKETNGLIKSWENNTCWMNPPYGKEIKKWVKKAFEESKNGVFTCALLPARTDTKWFHEYIYEKFEIFFLKGRIKFVGAKYSAPFPSMIVYFDKW